MHCDNVLGPHSGHRGVDRPMLLRVRTAGRLVRGQGVHCPLSELEYAGRLAESRRDSPDTPGWRHEYHRSHH